MFPRLRPRRSPTPAPFVLCILCALAAGRHHPVAAQVLQSFDTDGSGTAFAAASCLAVPAPPIHELLAGGPTGAGRFLRLGFEEPIPNHNSVTFDHVGGGAFDRVVADFDFRMIPGNGQADGFGFALLSTADFGLAGAVCPQAPLFAAEEPNFAGSLGIGFDIHQAPGSDLNANHLSIHFDGIEQVEVDVTPFLTLADSEWIHARILVGPAPVSGLEVSVILQPRGGLASTVVDRFALPGIALYASRVHLAARSGGESASHDFDNVEVHYLPSTESRLSFSAVVFDVVENSGPVVVRVRRDGESSTTVSVGYQTRDASATADADYSPASGTLSFAPGEVEKSFEVPLLDDGLDEGDEVLEVVLDAPTGPAVTGGPSVAGVRIVDDEAARRLGHWSYILSLPTVAVHLHLLPTGEVMLWKDGGAVDEVFAWDPASGDFRQLPPPPHDIFCAGHSLLADGRLLVTGGHDQIDGVGRRDATLYDPFQETWQTLPLMGGEGGRWYPTNTTLGRGGVLVLSGSFDEFFNKNTLPQVFEPDGAGGGTWRDLVDAQQLPPLGGDLYPRMFLAPDGRVLKAGDPDSWFLDVTGSGQWTLGPPSHFPATRTYGPAVFYDGRVLLVGGSDPPTESVESLDLSLPFPQWVLEDPMAFPRRHHNATLLPDGTVLVTGGTSCAGFNCATGAVLEAERWDPTAGSWSLLGPMEVKRLYHSTALLLPDGRVLTAGGGRPAADGEVDHHNAEIFSPPYLFRGPRPTVTSAPGAAGWGEPTFVETPDSATVTQVNLLRLGSVTHAFDQNQRFVSLAFTETVGGLLVTTPPSPHLAPAGHYLLFLVNSDGVPSVGRFLRLEDRPLFADGFESGDTSAWSAAVPPPSFALRPNLDNSEAGPASSAAERPMQTH